MFNKSKTNNVNTYADNKAAEAGAEDAAPVPGADQTIDDVIEHFRSSNRVAIRTSAVHHQHGDFVRRIRQRSMAGRENDK